MSGRKTDWESVEALYRAGQLSLREIGRQYSVSDTAIRKKAKKEGWERDLTKKINQKVRNELVRTKVRSETAQTEKDIIISAAAVAVDVVRGHQNRIVAAQSAVDTLLQQLIDAAASRDDLEDTIDIETAEDQSPLRRNAMLKAISMPVHASTLSNLATAMKTLVVLERQAFNIGDEPDDGTSSEFTDTERAARLATLFKRAGEARDRQPD